MSGFKVELKDFYIIAIGTPCSEIIYSSLCTLLKLNKVGISDKINYTEHNIHITSKIF